MTIDTAGLSKSGGRKTNQDAYGFKQNGPNRCWVVADGLGGHAGGEIASRMTVDHILCKMADSAEVSTDVIAEGFRTAQIELQRKATEDFSLSGMRTTLVVLSCNEEIAVWGHVGDSRLYWFRQGRIVGQTRDHSVPQMLVDAGKITFEEIRGHEDQNRLTRALGQPGEIHPTILSTGFPIHKGDAALLCTDGVWTYVTEQEMEAALEESSSAQKWLTRMEKYILLRAEGAYDNYTAIAVLF